MFVAHGDATASYIGEVRRETLETVTWQVLYEGERRNIGYFRREGWKWNCSPAGAGR